MPSRAAILADSLCDLMRELTAHRRGTGPHWLMVSTLARELRRNGVDLDENDLQAAITICVDRRTLKAEGRPPHSISPIEPWEIE